jgi:hypothetical protein
MQDVFRSSGGGEGSWKGLIGDAGVMGDLDAKAPELTGWGSRTSNYRDVNVNGENYKVHDGGVDLKGKGATELGQLGTSTLLNVQSASDVDQQFGNNLNWQAAATMASTPQLNPKDAESIQQWKEVGRRGINYWEQIGLDAANRGDQATYDRALENQRHAQTIVDSFGG